MQKKPCVWVVGTFDTKAEELLFLAQLLEEAGIPVETVDISTQAAVTTVDIPAAEVAACHERGAGYVLGGTDRGQAVTAMGEALRKLTKQRLQRNEILGMLGIGGSGGTSIITPAMHVLPYGMPKLLVTTMASGNTAAFVDIHDILVMNPVTDLAGLNRLSRRILANAAHAMSGMVAHSSSHESTDDKPAIGFSMFGVTTPCVQAVTRLLKERYECQIFHANGNGGRTMEAMARAGLLSAIVDITTTEVGQHLAGGVCDAGPGRLDAAAELGLPWIGSLGALDMINWGAPPTIPKEHADRLFHVHNPQVTLMRSTAEELERAGRRIAEQLNRSPGVVHLLLPMHGVSAIDAPGQPFHDPEANAVLFATLERDFQQTKTHHLEKFPLHINDPEFARVIAETVMTVLK